MRNQPRDTKKKTLKEKSKKQYTQNIYDQMQSDQKVYKNSNKDWKWDLKALREAHKYHCSSVNQKETQNSH